jgi:sulfate permease, SulP family
MAKPDPGWRSVPFLSGILPVDRARVPADLLAGVTLAALAIPEVLGYTKISGTPIITGLYTLLIPMALYALFGASRHLVVGADSATAAILASCLVTMAAPRSAEWLALSGILALLAAGFLLLARLARLGFLADFLSRTVLVGFLSGVGIQVAVGELPGMFGLSGGGVGTLGKLAVFLGEIGQVNPTALALSFAALVIVVVCRLVSRRIPGPLLAVLGAITLSWACQLSSRGIQVIGALPAGLPGIGLPQHTLDWALVQKLLPTAFALFVVILAQSAATSRAYAARYFESFDENVELAGLALANIGAGLSGTFVVNGSPTKTQIADSAGAVSQLAQLTTSLVVLLVLLFLTGPLAYLPGAVLSALVFLIGVELVDVGALRCIFRERPWEFRVALVTAAVVVLAGVEQSILLAIVLSLAVHTRHGYRPNNMLVVPDPVQGWRLQPVVARQQAAPGLLIYRFMHNMYYANAGVLTEEVAHLAREAEPPLRWFCIDLSAVDDVDFTAAAALRSLHTLLGGQGVRLVFCVVAREVREEFDRSGLSTLFGRGGFFASHQAVLLAYGQREEPQAGAGKGGAAGESGGPAS